MTYIGLVVIRKCFEGSKSEGYYVFLDTEQAEYRLFRKNAPSMNDVFFQPFDGKRVKVEGTVTDYWLSVKKITEIQGNKPDSTNSVELKEESNEKNM